MMSNTTIPSSPEAHGSEQTIGIERERLLDHRDELVTLVKGNKLELGAALERWCDSGRGSVKAMWQTMGAIGQGESQIAVIDLELESLSAS